MKPFPSALPAALGFLSNYGVSASVLLNAAWQARRQAVAPEAVLFASGEIEEVFYYKCLAHRLRAEFIGGWVQIGEGARYPHAIHTGLIALDSRASPRWLTAPRGRLLTELLLRVSAGECLGTQLAITTPSHFARLVRSAATASVLRDASLGLANLDPAFSAKTPPTIAQQGCAVALVAGTAFAFGLAPGPTLTFISLAMTCLFLASIWLRLFAGAASTASCQAPFRARVADCWLPNYSVIVALHREARVVRQLIAGLEALDYPRGKLDIKLVIEHDDRATCRAIEALRLPANYETVVAPAGWPRTKPRALNIALPLLRGELAVVFDAEDIPAPGQLREAAERFLRAPRKLACLQARLAIDNTGDSWLTKLFAIEYAMLFDVLNPGYAALGLPLPLGGSSNHFRVEVLRDVCGWDAWNVTEDADLGLRLARLGYGAGTIPSSTQEEAPARLGTWMKQRRRWSKGWMQTMITLTRDPRRLIVELGAGNSIAAGLMMTSLVIAPPLWPFFALLAVNDLMTAPPSPATPIELAVAVLWISAALFGTASIVWLALLGMKRRKLLGLWPFLPLLPFYYLLASAAAWMALGDLVLRPYHWHKTEQLEVRLRSKGLLGKQRYPSPDHRAGGSRNPKVYGQTMSPSHHIKGS
ncbi:MAG: glycosyltransferase, partial [Beijerinckiaceae bacterium]|nr:glycosyltransferase [Beijerinckiaceae bacterium]